MPTARSPAHAPAPLRPSKPLRPAPETDPDDASGGASGEASLAAALLLPKRPAPVAVKNARRFAVYRNNVAVGLIDALAATYPAVAALVGETFFRAAAREFALGNPPTSPVLINWGGAFPEWISAFPPAASVPYLGDVARLEWAWNEAYNAAEASPADIAALAALSPETVAKTRIALHPSLALVSSRFPVVSLWGQATGQTPPNQLDLATAETALIVRPEDTVEVRSIDHGTAAFLEKLIEGGTIANAAAAAGGDENILAERIAGLFQHRLATRLLPPTIDPAALRSSP